ncbi:MAG: NAD(+) diphosphatase, partial [Acetobacteraceae bacterium]
MQGNFYTGNPLDRATARREDAAWLAEALAAPGSRFLPLAGGKVRISDAAAARLTAAELGADPAALP